MAVIKTDYTMIDKSIRKLEKSSRAQAGRPSAALSFRGDFTFTKTFQELNTLMEENHVIWYNAAGYEAAPLKDMKQSLETMDKVLSGLIGVRHE